MFRFKLNHVNKWASISSPFWCCVWNLLGDLGPYHCLWCPGCFYMCWLCISAGCRLALVSKLLKNPLIYFTGMFTRKQPDDLLCHTVTIVSVNIFKPTQYGCYSVKNILKYISSICFFYYLPFQLNLFNDVIGSKSVHVKAVCRTGKTSITSTYWHLDICNHMPWLGHNDVTLSIISTKYWVSSPFVTAMLINVTKCKDKLMIYFIN